MVPATPPPRASRAVARVGAILGGGSDGEDGAGVRTWVPTLCTVHTPDQATGEAREECAAGRWLRRSGRPSLAPDTMPAMARTTHLGACPLDCPDTCVWQLDRRGRPGRRLRGDRDHPFTRGRAVRQGQPLPGRRQRPRPADATRWCASAPRAWGELVRAGHLGRGDRPRRGRAAGDDRAPRPRVDPAVLLRGHDGARAGLDDGPRLFAHLGASRLRTTICTAAATAACARSTARSVGFEPETHRRGPADRALGRQPAVREPAPVAVRATRRSSAGAHVVAIDPIRTDTATRCDEHLAPLPGTDAALALGLMRHVLRRRRGRPRVARGAHRRLAGARGAARRVAGRARRRGVRARRRRRAPARRAHRDHPPRRPIRLGLGLQRHDGAGQAIRAILALPLVTGDFRYPGGGGLCMTRRPPPHRRGRRRAPADGLPAPPARTINMSRLAEALTARPTRRSRRWSCSTRTRRRPCPTRPAPTPGLRREDLFTTVLEQRWTDTCDFADVVLPATMQPEHLDLHSSYGHHYTTLNLPVTDPPGEALPERRDLPPHRGGHGPRPPAAARQRRGPRAPAAGRHRPTLEELRETTYAAGRPASSAAPRRSPTGGFPTPSGRARSSTPALGAPGVDPLVGYTPPVEVADAELAERFPLVLRGARGPVLHELHVRLAALALGKQGPPLVHLHPDDAEARGLVDGDPVRVHNDRGSFLAACARRRRDPARPRVHATRPTGRG